MTAIRETATAHATTVPPTISMITPLPQLTTPSPEPTTVPTTTSIPALPDFSSLFSFDQRVSSLETKLSQLKQADLSVQLLESVKSQLPTMVDDLLSTRIGHATRTALESYTKDFEKKAQEERSTDFATPMIQSTITESLENVVLAKSSSQPQSTYEAASSLTEFELKKILIDKLEKSKSGDLFGARMSVQAEEPVFETADTETPQDQEGDTEEQPNVEATPRGDWFKKPTRPLTPDPEWSATNSVDSRQPQQWKYTTSTTKTKAARYDNIEGIEGPKRFYGDNAQIDVIAAKYRKTRKGETNMRRLSQVRRIMHQDQVRKHLKEAQGRQVVPADYFNNDLEYLKGGSYNRKYTTSTTKIKAARYDNIEGIEDMVPELWSPVKVAYDKFAMWGISH
ncbi:hypothetical protein Tco_0913470 [Tanacetum coccineum]